MENLYSEEDRAQIVSYEELAYSLFCEWVEPFRPRFLAYGAELATCLVWQDFKTGKGFEVRPDSFDGYTCFICIDVIKDNAVVDVELDGEPCRLSMSWCIGSRLSKVPIMTSLYQPTKKYVPYRYCTKRQFEALKTEAAEDLEGFLDALQRGKPIHLQ